MKSQAFKFHHTKNPTRLELYKLVLPFEEERILIGLKIFQESDILMKTLVTSHICILLNISRDSNLLTL